MSFVLVLAAALSAGHGAPGIRGAVRTRSGEPLPRAEIRLQRVEDSPRPGPTRAFTDESGAFATDPPGPGSYFVWASALGYLDARAGPIEVKEGQTAEGVSISLLPVGEASLSGRVMDLEGEPLSGVKVEAVSPGYALGTAVEKTTGPDGRYRFEALTAGSTEVSFFCLAPEAAPEAAVRSKAPVNLQAGVEATRDAKLARPEARLAGRVLGPTGEAFPSVRAFAAYEPTFTEAYLFRGGSATSGRDGLFRIDGLVAGEYRVQFFGRLPGTEVERFLGEATGVRSGGDAIEYRVPAELPVLVEGVCLREDSGSPLIGSEVTLEVAGKVAARDRSDREGKFSLGAPLSKDLPNILRARHREYGAEDRWLHASEVRPDGRYPDVVFTVTRARSVPR